MNLLIQAASRASFKCPPIKVVKEKAAAFDTFTAYSRTMEVVGNEVRHRIEAASFPNLVGTAHVRKVAITSGLLRLTSARDGPKWITNGFRVN